MAPFRRGCLGTRFQNSSFPPEAEKFRRARVSRRELIAGVGLISATAFLGSTNASAQANLVVATLRDPRLSTSKWKVGGWLTGKFTAQNDDACENQNGDVVLILWDEVLRAENSRSFAIGVPHGATIIVPFDRGPPAKKAGAKSLDIESALNTVHTEFLAR
jgi:hypothetical protein